MKECDHTLKYAKYLVITYFYVGLGCLEGQRPDQLRSNYMADLSFVFGLRGYTLQGHVILMYSHFLSFSRPETLHMTCLIGYRINQKQRGTESITSFP